MNFVSVEFFIFLAVTLAAYWALGHGPARTWFLTLASYVFYAWWDWRFCGLMLFVTLNAWLAGRYVHDVRERLRKPLLAASIAVDLAVLAFFKYFNFFEANAKAASEAVGLDLAWPALQVVLPIGISFYTFHAISYVIDVWRRKIRPERSFLKVALYIAFFPQLIAGPIVRASFFMPQLARTPRFRAAQQITGIKLFLRGFIYKAAIADRLSGIVDPIFAKISDHNGADLLTATVAFYGQIYFDFAGYSLMAIGTARLFGYRIPPNFNYPYSSLSVTEFWRRWHISLSSWLRDYLYIPLGGNRFGALATYRNLMITMVLGGLWHGASWNFVIWGFLHGLGLLVHKLWLELRERGGFTATASPYGGAAALLVTQAWVFIAWIFFRVETLPGALRTLGAVFSANSYAAFDPGQPAPWIMLLIVLDHLLGRARLRASLPERRRAQAFWLISGALAALGLVLMPLTQKAFIYFQF